MRAITRSLVTAQLLASAHVLGLLERVRDDERGQASAEYAGIIFVIVAIVTAVIGASAGWGADLVAKITGELAKIQG